ncbi:HBS1-like protein [Linum perenne]
MPRKVNSGVDYDEDYDDYEDYDYDDDCDYNVESNVQEPEEKINKPAVWSCSICTYDNDEGMSACDICGVIRKPVAGDFKNSNKKTADCEGKCSGVSLLAKSLFASSPPQTSLKAMVGQLHKDDFSKQSRTELHKCGSSQKKFHVFHNSYILPSRSHFNLAPFKFDVPSPDDMVSSGLHSSKMITKGNIKPTKENGAENAHSTIQRSENSSKPRGKQGKQDDINLTDDAVDGQSDSKSSHHSLAVISHGRDTGIAGKNSSKSEILSSQQSDEASSSSTQMKLKEKHNGDDNLNDGSAPSNNFGRMALSEQPGNLIAPKSRKAKSTAEYKPDKWMLPDNAKGALTQLNLAIVGHVDSGKSTLSGRLLHLLGRISAKEMHKYEKEAKIQGKGSFAYAWALDESPEERERGITMNVAVAYFDSKKYHVVVLDSPGHKDFVPNMISGATQADAAILVIDASNGAFEAGLDGSKGQTKEHAQLIRSFGVEQIIVGINKMDAVGYSKDRFDFVTSQLGVFLRSCGFKDSSILWIPLSAIENQNLVAAPSDARLSSWYKGPYLLDAIDSLQPPARDFAKPLLMPICDVIKSSSQGQVSACGKLEAGALRSGLKVMVMPSGEVGTIKSLERDSHGCTAARAGDNVSVNLQGVDGSNVMPGGVICHPDYPVGVASHLELKVLALELPIPILNGLQLEFHIHHAQEAGRVAKIVSLLDPKTGKETKRSPRCLLSKQSAVIEVVLNGAVCVEEFSNSRALGRAFLRASGRTIAVGIVTRIIQ